MDNKADSIKVSVIIPVYNVQDYLAQCIESVLCQSLREIEIICINDGSSDNSFHILKEYGAKDKRIKVFTQLNQGLSATRNRGLAIARGKYICFLDSDDYLEKCALDELSNKMDQEDLDIVCYDGNSFLDDSISDLLADVDYDYYHRKKDYPDVYSGVQLLTFMEANRDYRPSACLQLFKREYLYNQNLFFYEGIIHEDNMFTFSAWVHARRVGYIKKCFYNRRYRKDSIVTTSYQFRHVYGYFLSYLQMTKELMNLEVTKEEAEALSKVVSRVLHNARNIFSQLPLQEQDLFQELPSWQKIIFEDLIHNEAKLKDELKQKQQKLNKAYEEKSEINEKLQRTYREKSEINEKLQQTYREKSEINRKLQLTYKEKADRGIQIRELKSECELLQKKLQEIQNKRFFHRRF